MSLITDLITRFAEPVISGVLASLGGVMNYLYEHERLQKALALKSFFINVSLAFFVGFTLSFFLPDDFFGRDGMLTAAGFCAYPILDWLQANGWKNLVARVFKTPPRGPQ